MEIALPCEMPSRGNRSEAYRVDHRLDIADPSIVRNIIHFPVRQAVTSCVITDQRVLPGEAAPKMAPCRALPIIFEVPGKNHLLLEHEPACDRFFEEIRLFLKK